MSYLSRSEKERYRLGVSAVAGLVPPLLLGASPVVGGVVIERGPLMTWGEMKRAVEAMGVQDDAVVEWIEISGLRWSDLLVEYDGGSGALRIYNSA